MLHCGRCGGELNNWAICQPCRLLDTLNKNTDQVTNSVKSFDIFDTSQDYRRYSGTPSTISTKPTLNGIISALIIFAICVGAPFAIIIWCISVFAR